MQKTLASRSEFRALRRAMEPYGHPVLWMSLWQMANTFIPLAVCWYLAYRSLEISYLLTVVFSLLCAGFVVRITIFQHDCGHYSFFRSRWANEWLGMFCSLFNLTPFSFWLRQHAYHHTKINNLDRGDRDVLAECLTVEEYRSLSPFKRWVYRVSRDPLVFFPVIAPLTMLLATRFPLMLDRTCVKERRNVYMTNVALVLLYGGLGFAVGFVELMLIQLPILIVGSAVGLWLDFLGHKFPGSSWVHDDEWNLSTAALTGCGYFKLPKVLQWFSGNIGIHHVHHLNPRIPNYLLQKCHDETPQLHAAKSFNLWQGIKAAWLVLWDEDRRRLVRFGEMDATSREA